MPTVLYPMVAEWDEAVLAWSLLSPEFPEIASSARDPEDLAQQAQDALTTAIACRIEDGETVPPPNSKPWLLTQDWHYPTKNMLLLVPVQTGTKTAEPVRVNVSLDKRLLARIDSEAARLGMTRSGFLAESAKSRLRG